MEIGVVSLISQLTDISSVVLRQYLLLRELGVLSPELLHLSIKLLFRQFIKWILLELSHTDL